MSPDIPDGWDERRAKEGAMFLQSSGWAEFQNALGLKTYLLEGKGWSCLLVGRRNRIGRYLFAPYGPTLGNASDADACLKELADFAKGKSAQWLKIEPLSGLGDADMPDKLRRAGFKRAGHDVNPHLTRIIDLTPSEDLILAAVSQSTRSLIRKNARENTLTFQTSTEPADISLFITMLRRVSARNKVRFFEDDYFRKQAETLMPKGMMFLELAYHQGKPVGAAVIHDFAGQSSYTYAASLDEARRLNSSALLLWQSIINAKRRGNQRIDLYGVAPEDAPPSHPWYGFSAYKRKFGGEVIERAGTWDLPLSGRFTLYRGAQSLNRRVRSLNRR